MPQFRGPVTITGYITVEGEDMYDADEKAQYLSAEQVWELINKERGRLDVEVFDHEFPEEI